MEDILGVLIFVIFIVVRVMGDRKKGMKKEPAKPQTKPLIQTKKVETKKTASRGMPVSPIKPTTEKPRLERSALEPVFMGAQQREQQATGIQLDEGESYFAKLPVMEGVEKGNEVENLPILEVEKQANQETAFFLGAEDVRKAIVWSEVIQKPRFRTKLH